MTTSLSPAGLTLPVVPEDPAGRDLLARFYRALGDPTRLALLGFCSQGEHTGSECVAYAGLSQGRVSAHLACLVSCGLLSLRREGRFAYYEVTDPRVGEFLGIGREIVADHTRSIAACVKVGPADTR
jgi:DNA-binding transcriptional ArsR family regulator